MKLDREVLAGSASKMAALVASERLSPVELVEAHLEQIERINPKLNAFVDLRPEAALAEARAAETMVTNGGLLGPLHGVPISIKSCIDVAGMKCEAGSKLRAGNIPKKDAVLVQRLKAAGAIILGVTNTPEFLMAWETDNLLYGRTNNPWDLERTPGGSSGGESAAIAACMSACGVGSDGGGSVRVPAHYTGICALKPTPGRIPATGHFPSGVGPFAWLGQVGPMARYVEDLHLMLGIMSGYDIGDPVAAPVPLVEIDASELREIKIGYFEDDGVHPVSPETRNAVQAAAKSLADQGYIVEPCRPDHLARVHELWQDVFVRMTAMLFAPMLKGKEQRISPILADMCKLQSTLPSFTAESLLTSIMERDIIGEAVLRQMERYPIWLLPVAPGPAFRHGEIGWTRENHSAAFVDTFPYTQWFNLLGCPAAVVPVSQSEEGLPIGVQIAGRPWDDALVLAVAAAIEREFGYKPPPAVDNEL
jgi:Asp-tRNA(Asn)/Glu-tRNA(Gln) amidotransferase A subunit family amidase